MLELMLCAPDGLNVHLSDKDHTNALWVYGHITSDQAYLFSHLLAKSGRLSSDYSVNLFQLKMHLHTANNICNKLKFFLMVWTQDFNCTKYIKGGQTYQMERGLMKFLISKVVLLNFKIPVNF